MVILTDPHPPISVPKSRPSQVESGVRSQLVLSLSTLVLAVNPLKGQTATLLETALADPLPLDRVTPAGPFVL